jgi:hypothetical protein
MTRPSYRAVSKGLLTREIGGRLGAAAGLAALAPLGGLLSVALAGCGGGGAITTRTTGTRTLTTPTIPTTRPATTTHPGTTEAAPVPPGTATETLPAVTQTLPPTPSLSRRPRPFRR